MDFAQENFNEIKLIQLKALDYLLNYIGTDSLKLS